MRRLALVAGAAAFACSRLSGALWQILGGRTIVRRMRSFPIGTFGSDDSTALFRVRADGDGNPRVEGWDRSDGERFKINGVVWDGKELRFTSTMPSNSFVVHHRVRPGADGAIEGWRSSTGKTYVLKAVDAKPTA